MLRKCILFTGIQASGKTTFYHRYFSDLTHVNLDTLHTRNRERLLLEACLASGASFVVDNTNPLRSDRARYILPARAHGYRILGYYFRSSITECKKRNELRTGSARLPSVALAATHRVLELPSWDEGFDELYHVRIDGSDYIIEPWEASEV